MSLKSLLQTAIILLLSVPASQAQRFYSVVFSKLPQDFQLYPRDAASEAVVPISGVVEAAGWKYMSIQVSRNNVVQKYVKAELKYGSAAKATFSAETKIKAELANYSFKIFVCKDGDSTEVVTRRNVVSGDVYVLSGQSNSTGFFGESDTTQFCRTFGKITGTLNTEGYNAADTLWTVSNSHGYDDNVGSMGFEIQKQLMEKSGIPNCLINAGFHWSSAYAHAQRTEGNPADLSNGYGRMLYRLQKGALTGGVKAYIFRQGETEAYHEGSGWEENFGKLKKNLETDLPNIQKFYVFQIDIIYYPSPVGAMVRDYQRRLPEIYPNAESLATVGTKEFDGLHYGKAGNQQGGFELSRMMLKDFYALKDTANIYSPSVKKVFYKTAERKQLVLVFDEGQELIYPETQSNSLMEMKQLFYMDDNNGSVASGKAEGNRIVLELNGPQNGSRLNYLPLYIPQDSQYHPFYGPFITNKLGMRAFSFYNVAINMPLATPALTAAEQANKNVKLSWLTVPEATAYILERKLQTEATYTTLATFPAQTLEYTDLAASNGVTIQYRLKAIGKTSESGDFAYAQIEAPVILGTEKEGGMYTAFPNPVVKGQPVNIQFLLPSTGSISITNIKGQSLSETKIKNSRDVIMTLPEGPAGLHFIRFTDGSREWTKKILVR